MSARSLRFLVQMSERVDRLRMGSFWDLDQPRERHVAAQRMVFATLDGLALERSLMPGMLESRADPERLTRAVINVFEKESS